MLHVLGTTSYNTRLNILNSVIHLVLTDACNCEIPPLIAQISMV